MKKLPISQLNDLFSAISRLETLYLPTDAGFVPYSPETAMTRRVNTGRSPKDLFFPQVETLMGFRTRGQSIELLDRREETKPFVIFGVRACDCRSFDILDSVFLAPPEDTFYKNRRQAGVIVTLACNRPEETCFCSSFAIDPAEPAGDVSAWQTEDTLYLRANTEKGEKLLAQLSLLQDADPEQIVPLQEQIRQSVKRLPIQELPLEQFGAAHMMERFSSEKWDELSQSCLGCGSCTYVCPTCQCYDIKEFTANGEIQRYRCWDSCMYSDFTQMSAGQPRPTQKERFRQRFLHKLCYHPANHGGEFSCVGCGRCLQKCPIHMNIVKVIRTLGEEDA